MGPGIINAKIGDFGLAQYTLPQLNEMLACWQWLAPEVFDARSTAYNEIADSTSRVLCPPHPSSILRDLRSVHPLDLLPQPPFNQSPPLTLSHLFALVYSYGIVLWELSSRTIPFSEFQQFITIEQNTLTPQQLSNKELLSGLESNGYVVSLTEGTARKESYKVRNQTNLLSPCLQAIRSAPHGTTLWLRVLVSPIAFSQLLTCSSPPPLWVLAVGVLRAWFCWKGPDLSF